MIRKTLMATFVGAITLTSIALTATEAKADKCLSTIVTANAQAPSKEWAQHGATARWTDRVKRKYGPFYMYWGTARQPFVQCRVRPNSGYWSKWECTVMARPCRAQPL